MTKEKRMIGFNQRLDEKYGKPGSKARDRWEQGYATFELGVMLEEARLKLGLTQEEVAERCGTNKSYISRVENDATDVRMSTFFKIIHQGLGAKLDLKILLVE